MSTRPFRGRPDPGDEQQSRQRLTPGDEYVEDPESASLQSETPYRSFQQYGANDSHTSDAVKVDLGKRLVAFLADVLVGYVIEVVINCIPLLNMVVHDHLAMAVYLTVRDSLFDGKGVGKRLMGLQVVDRMSGMPASIIQSVKRNIVVIGPYFVLYILSAMPFHIDMLSFAVTTIMQIYFLVVVPSELWRVYSTDDGLRWGDHIAGTATVLAETEANKSHSR